MKTNHARRLRSFPKSVWCTSIERLERLVATPTCVLHLAGLCCKVDFVEISCYFNVDMCTWERNYDQQISNTLSLRLLEEICSASLIALIGTCACWAWYACIGWKSIQDHSGTSLHFIKGFVHIAAICKLAPQSVVVWHHVVWGDMMWHDVTWCHMMWHDVRWCDIMWHDLTWCVMFESLWWSSKLIRCQRMRLHPKPEDKPCASTEDFSKHCWLYWIIERLESSTWFLLFKRQRQPFFASQCLCLIFERNQMVCFAPWLFPWDFTEIGLLSLVLKMSRN